MRTLLVSALLASSLGVGLGFALAGCSSRPDAAPERASRGPARDVPTVSVDELDRMLANHECQAVDANGDATRKRMGVIPGAVLLRDMAAVDQLPADKTTGLVFYCANAACRSSHEAAERAITAGYTQVKELPAGIAGWVKAGKQTTAL